MTSRPCRSCGCYVKQGEQSSPCVRCPGKRATIDDMDVAYDMAQCSNCPAWILNRSDGSTPVTCQECFNSMVAECGYQKHKKVRGTKLVLLAHTSVCSVDVYKYVSKGIFKHSIETLPVCQKCINEHGLETVEQARENSKKAEFSDEYDRIAKAELAREEKESKKAKLSFGQIVRSKQVYIVKPVAMVERNGRQLLECVKLIDCTVDEEEVSSIETGIMYIKSKDVIASLKNTGEWHCIVMAGSELVSSEDQSVSRKSLYQWVEKYKKQLVLSP